MQQRFDFNLLQEFRREGSDLHMVHRIGLVEALCGFQMTITHLDSRQLLVKYPPGKVIEPGKYVFRPHLLIFIFVTTALVTLNQLPFKNAKKKHNYSGKACLTLQDPTKI